MKIRASSGTGRRSLLHVEHLVKIPIHEPCQAFVLGLIRRGAQNKAEGLSVRTAVKGKGVLPLQIENQVALSDGA